MISPLLILDKHESWSPVAVETILDVGAKLRTGDALASIDAVTLDWLTGAERIDFPADMAPTDVPLDAPLVGYHRALEAGGLYWSQFWTFWLYNPKTYAGFGAHEGDWELVQFGCTDPELERVVLVTCSQHDGGEKREGWRVELKGGQPVVYVARDSHANYFAPMRDVSDQADGEGDALETIEWRDFGDWSEWPGQWGNSDNSPGPLSTRRAWTAPHAYHGQAR